MREKGRENLACEKGPNETTRNDEVTLILCNDDGVNMSGMVGERDRRKRGGKRSLIHACP